MILAPKPLEPPLHAPTGINTAQNTAHCQNLPRGSVTDRMPLLAKAGVEALVTTVKVFGAVGRSGGLDGVVRGALAMGQCPCEKRTKLAPPLLVRTQ